MSKWFKENIVMVIINTLIVIIMAIIGFNVKAMVTEVREVEQKAKDYTDRELMNHVAKEQIIFNSINQSIESVKDQNQLILDNQNKIINMSMDRIKRLEDKVYKD